MDKPRHWPLFIILSLVAVFLTPLWWWLCAGSARADYWQSGWIKSGLMIMIASTVMLFSWPLWGRLFYAVPSDNPIGLGLLYLLLMVIGSGLTLVGDIIVAIRRNKAGHAI
jgi:hypothetical protein